MPTAELPLFIFMVDQPLNSKFINKHPEISAPKPGAIL